MGCTSVVPIELAASFVYFCGQKYHACPALEDKVSIQVYPHGVMTDNAEIAAALCLGFARTRLSTTLLSDHLDS